MEEIKNKPDLDFLGIGVVKCGTTWISECLSAHPEIFIPFRKEIGFFDSVEKESNYSKGFDWYGNFFISAGLSQKKGEYTNHYMFWEKSADLIKGHYPNIKLIVAFRNPAEMIYSYYWWKKANFDSYNMSSSFEEEIKNNEEFIERGKYHSQLKRFLEKFPRKNIKVIFLRDIKKDPHKVLSELYSFLGVDQDFRPSFMDDKINTSKQPRFSIISTVIAKAIQFLEQVGLSRLIRDLKSSRRLSKIYTILNKKNFTYPRLNKNTRRAIIRELEEEISSLEKLLDIDLSYWRE